MMAWIPNNNWTLTSPIIPTRRSERALVAPLRLRSMVIGSIGGGVVALGPPFLSSAIERPHYYSIICLVKQIFVKSFMMDQSAG